MTIEQFVESPITWMRAQTFQCGARMPAPEPIIYLVGTDGRYGCGRNHGGQGKISQVGQEGRGQKRSVPFDCRSDKQDQVAVP